jgi:uracil phosphoribosyltransferase
MGVVLADRLHQVESRYAQEILMTLRDKKTDRVKFRWGLSRLGMLIGAEIAGAIDYADVTVETPLGAKAKGVSITDARHIVVISVLRAAIPFVEGLLDVFPKARLGVVSASRVEDKHLAPEYDFKIDMPYTRVPAITPSDTLIVADPMLASGSTQIAVLDKLLKNGKPKRVIVASVLSAPLGLEKVHTRHPEVEIFTFSVDEGLDERGYIVPGLGDAGDRVSG